LLDKDLTSELLRFMWRADAAGAIVDGGTTNRIETYISLNPESRHSALRAKDALRDHDAYNFFNSGNDDSLIKTGPTGTNVADVCITLVR
jgi:glycerate-2-kinase